MQEDVVAAVPVILIGARSRSGRAIAEALARHPITSIMRHAAKPGDVAVADYAEIPAGIAFEGAVVINCVGTDRGPAALLDHLNRDVPAAWARAAKAGGARQFVQLSSFSIYGAVEEIGSDTPIDPATDYGRSKLAAETALAALAGEGFTVTLLRVPILVGEGEDKLAQLVRLVRSTGVAPRTRRPVRRSMLSYAGLAAVVRALIARPVAGPVCAADPEPFTYDMMAEAAASAGRRLRRLPVPGFAEALLRATAPGIHRRLFTSAFLAPAANIAPDALPFERVADVLSRSFTAGSEGGR